jgi:hypothetical protein
VILDEPDLNFEIHPGALTSDNFKSNRDWHYLFRGARHPLASTPQELAGPTQQGDPASLHSAAGSPFSHELASRAPARALVRGFKLG